MKQTYLIRIRIISIGIFIFALFLIGKLYILQVVDADIYAQKADRQYMSSSGGVFSRGSIFFENKDGSDVSAATLKSGFIVAINPEILQNPEDVFQKIHVLLPDVPHDFFIAKATKKKDPYEVIAKRVDLEIGQKIDELKINGLKVYKERWRFYPGGTTAAHAIGLLGFKGDEFAGRYGLERSYENVLSRTEGSSVNFFAQIFSNMQSGTASSTSEGDIVTTIEPTVQNFLETQLATTTHRWNSEYTGGIIMDPKTGEIIAMAGYPTFNGNNPQDEKNSSIFSNNLVENVYEMGSVVKPLTLAAGIDAGLVTATTTYYDKGFVIINNKKISNFDGKERGVVTIQDALSQSLNVGMAYIERLLGNKRFSGYMYGFGLDQKTGIDLPNESHNLVDNLKSPRDIEHATASFGQGIALTPISLTRAVAAIANGGTLVTPHLVKKINYKIGFSKTISPSAGPRVIERSTAEEVARMMTYSTDHTLLNGTLRLPNYSVAVKTGTAQIAKSGGGGYSENEFLHSFVGFFPSYNPRFIIFLFSVKPKGVQFGSETLSIPFMDTVKFLVNYYDIPPDR